MAKAPDDDVPAPEPPAAPTAPQECGVVMPISEIDGCLPSHWAEVKSILFDAIEAAGLKPNLVSDAADAGIIHGRIIENLYKNEMVVCDVSGKNPNVMFELGIRLAFGKPTVVVKDDRTAYSFDTAPIEHVPYRRDLRYQDTVDFKARLGEKITGTLKAVANGSYKTFLSHFGTYTVAKLDSKEVPEGEFIRQQLDEIRRLVSQTNLTTLNLTSAGVEAVAKPATANPSVRWKLRPTPLPENIVPDAIKETVAILRQKGVTDWEGVMPQIVEAIADKLSRVLTGALLPDGQQLETMVRAALIETA